MSRGGTIHTRGSSRVENAAERSTELGKTKRGTEERVADAPQSPWMRMPR